MMSDRIFPTIDRATACHVVAASFMGWMLDACDFFIVLFTLDNVANSYHASIGAILWAPTLTLLTRPIGAFLCGRSADRYGRKPVMIATITIYSLIEVASSFAPSLTVFLLLRALFGIALGGQWGVGTSLIMESVPPAWRGWSSGLLQAGYPAGYLLASLMYLLLPVVGWRGLYIMGSAAIFVAIYIWIRIPESPEWRGRLARGATHADGPGLLAVIRGNMSLWLFAVALMTAFTFFSHGSQDLYPKLFLRLQRGLTPSTVTLIVVLYNVSAILGGLVFGALSQRIGRQFAIAIGAFAVLPLLPLWTLPHSPFWLALGAIGVQFCVQGAWGVVPAYLSELSPASVRATFPGLAYQCGNLIAASNALLQNRISEMFGGDLAPALIAVVGAAGAVLLTLTLLNAFLHPTIVPRPSKTRA
ncbi:MFS transporter [Acidomonas methanolica]|nr:MFS transporter [Acidomonas methanolica]